MSRTAGVIGLGDIGGRIASVLTDAYDVVVHDLDPDRENELAEQGASVADSARAVGERADVVLLSLPSDGALRAVALDDGVVAGLSSGDVLVDTSTVSPELVETVADACEADGIGYLDAPVSGGARNAETGSLTVLVGGDEETLEAVRPILDTIGETIHHVGPTGTGMTLKVVNNYMFAMNQVVLAEGLAMAREAGIPDQVFADTVGDSSGGSYALDRDMEGFILPDDYDSEFTLSLMRKDAGIAERFATANDVPLLLGGTSGLYRVGEAMGYGDLDSSAIARVYEDLQADE